MRFRDFLPARHRAIAAATSSPTRGERVRAPAPAHNRSSIDRVVAALTYRETGMILSDLPVANEAAEQGRGLS